MRIDRLRLPPALRKIEMHLALRTAALGALLVAASCNTIQVDSYYDEGFDFRPLKTYKWMEDRQVITGDERVKNEIMMTMIKELIDEGMAARGFTRANDKADFLVGYHAAVTAKLDVRTMNDYYGYGVPTIAGSAYGPGWRTSGTVRTQVHRYDQGTLIIDVAEPTKRKLIWRGSATDRVHPGNEQAEKRKNLSEGIAQILENFPPY